MKKNKVILYIIYFFTAVGLIAFDQFSKVLAINHLKDKNPIVIIKNVFAPLCQDNNIIYTIIYFFRC